MSKRLIGLLGLALFAVQGTVLAAGTSQVQSSFRSTANVALSRAIVVPTIASVTLPAEVADSQVFGVYNAADDAFLPYEVRRTASNAVSVQVSGAGLEASALAPLTDRNHATVVDFPLPEVPGKQGSVTLQYEFEAPITSDSLRMSLSQYVVRPTAITIRADSNGQPRTVLARTRPEGNTVSFPAFTSRTWTVTLEFSQPLRFTELAFVNADVVETSATLLFLAQPGKSYVLYSDPEVVIPQETGERPQFSDLTTAVSGSLTGGKVNSVYKPADSDEDGIADLSDNCPRIANADQADIDTSGRGDVCEDFDQDGVMQGTDNCPDAPNRDQADIDRDGVGDACDTEESRITEQYPGIVWGGLAFAVLVFAGLFYIALRRHRQTNETPSKETPPTLQ